MLKRKSNLADISDKVIAELIEELTLKLRTQAYQSGWPPHICAVLSIHADDDHNLYVSYPDEFSKEVDDLEYGGEQTRPHALIRPFMYRTERYIKDKLNNEWMSDILDVMGVI